MVSLSSCNIEMYSRDGANYRGTDAGIYDIHGVALRTAVLKAYRKGLRLHRAYLAYSYDDNENN